jgi:hypothetical protein
VVGSKLLSESDLCTSKEATINGFVEQAKCKAQLAAKYVEQAQHLRTVLATVDSIPTLYGTISHDFLLPAAGLSEKAIQHLPEEELGAILAKIFTDLDSDTWRDELLVRYLLTKGDSLGGTLRNVTGSDANERVALAVLSFLQDHAIPIYVESDKYRTKSIAWPNRLLLFNRKVPVIGKNVDLILLDATQTRNEAALLKDGTVYLACGEIKGSIDPASADQHWKSAKGSLHRLASAFEPSRASLFLIAASILPAEAKEIISELTAGTLHCAANLTNTDQLTALIEWLVAL